MKQRVIWKMFVLTIVTLGFYRLYWFIKTRREMMTINPNIKIMSPLFLILPLVLILGSVGLLLFGAINAGIHAKTSEPTYCVDRQQKQTAQSSLHGEQPVPIECPIQPPIWAIVPFYVSMIFILPLLAVWVWSYSKGVEIITNNKLSFPVAILILLAVPDGIDILLVQDTFNKLAPSADSPSVPMAV